LRKSYFHRPLFINIVTVTGVKHFEFYTFIAVPNKYYEYMLDIILQNIGMYYYFNRQYRLQKSIVLLKS